MREEAERKDKLLQAEKKQKIDKGNTKWRKLDWPLAKTRTV